MKILESPRPECRGFGGLGKNLMVFSGAYGTEMFRGWGRGRD